MSTRGSKSPLPAGPMVVRCAGYDPADIRVVFDDRAAAAGIADRLHWLLDGVCPATGS